MQPIIDVQNINFAYMHEEQPGNQPQVLCDVSLQVPQGQFVAIVGHNGSGKSTLARHLNALLLPDSGAVYIKGMHTADESLLWQIRGAAGMVFQNPDNQLVATLVEDDVAFGAENMGVPHAELRRRVDDALEQVHMSEYAQRAPHMLSGGQKQRVAIAGVLALRPQIIIMDEPTAMLDPSGRRKVMRTIEALHASGITVVLITHFMEEAAHAQRVVVMDDGRIALDGTPREVFAQGERLRALGLAVPPMAALAHLLRAGGMDLPEGLLTTQEMADAICQFV